ncbi:methyl-accepting chemotaxis protein [Rhizobium leguminosarum]|uniref:methyl-accepting chemotaxis protein n=1 Tax=Rhizobium leguminosarum TaxID=384 RepID=UPI001C97F724|nr:HAMP domain-containing methyl-accepting chemotaxis protein [Rhizobium leguminosarum]MBY5521444.1 HAMP domain-containing protein [Rhizobium leguminosarum]MBY5551393.1 HAMP domain-containing protein [Rhizobium leguminosarum]MBY5586495.1 HAMP domain-containing protein [Rhizobium leguminosarum]MBY5600948.1 HAMP domain-containing protein [Rhizobium leguminosarum]MBY5701533.1 HAMP domain-containing protein [Rhizobium leguminosarum]
MALTIARSLVAFGVAVSAGLFMSIGLQQSALERLKVNGPVYEQVVYGKDLIADILPPPLFVVESYMLSFEASKFPELAETNLAKIANLKAAYDDRRAYWKTTRLPQALKDELENDVIAKGDAFWGVMNREIIPALTAKDEDKAHGAIEQLRVAFHSHQDAIENLVANSDAFLKGEERNAASEIVTWTIYAGAAGLGSFGLLLVGLYLLRRRAIVPLDGMKAYMGNLAEGDFSTEVPYANRSDEIGAMSKAVAVFRHNALERQDAQKRETALRDAEFERERSQLAERAAEEQIRETVIDRLTYGLEQLSTGNLDCRITTPFAAAYETLRAKFNDSMDALCASMAEIAQTSKQVGSSSAGITEAADSLASRTEQQAAMLEEATAALDEMNAKAKDASAHAGKATGMMAETRTSAEHSAAVVREAIAAMERIEGSSSQIGDIVNVIDEIAFQTNLLALNAGVEAARAGEAGKGFAVVAQEVRELALRSANAAKEIRALISTSSSQVSTGVQLVNRTGKALLEIEGQVEQVAGLIAHIVSVSSEQAVAIGEINASVNALDQVTQRNAAMAVETASACRALGSQTQTLEGVVNRFQIDATATGSKPRKAA